MSGGPILDVTQGMVVFLANGQTRTLLRVEPELEVALRHLIARFPRAELVSCRRNAEVNVSATSRSGGGRG